MLSFIHQAKHCFNLFTMKAAVGAYDKAIMGKLNWNTRVDFPSLLNMPLFLLLVAKAIKYVYIKHNEFG